MRFIRTFSLFAKDETAAVTVDWVVLTAALVLVGGGVIAVVNAAIGSNGTAISSNIVSSVSSVLP